MAVEKSAVLFEVAIWEEDADFALLEKMIRDIKMDGLTWGEAKKVNVVSTIYKLQIIAAVEEKVSVDEVTETIEAFSDIVQSVDIISFTKM